jgi:hypothetical protein
VSKSSVRYLFSHEFHHRNASGLTWDNRGRAILNRPILFFCPPGSKNCALSSRQTDGLRIHFEESWHTEEECGRLSNKDELRRRLLASS